MLLYDALRYECSGKHADTARLASPVQLSTTNVASNSHKIAFLGRNTLPHLNKHPKKYHSCLAGAKAGSGAGYEHALRTGCAATCRVYRNVEKQTCLHGCETLAREVRACALQPPPAAANAIVEETISIEGEAIEAAQAAAGEEAAARMASAKQAAAEAAEVAAAAEEKRKLEEEAAAAAAAAEEKNLAEEKEAKAAAATAAAAAAAAAADDEAKAKAPPLPPTGVRPPLPEQ